MGAVIWPLVRVSPSIILASVGKASFCLISTSRSHGVPRTGNAPKKLDTKHNKPINFHLGIKTSTFLLPSSHRVTPRRQIWVFQSCFFFFLSSRQRRKEQDSNTKYVPKGGKKETSTSPGRLSTALLATRKMCWRKVCPENKIKHPFPHS